MSGRGSPGPGTRACGSTVVAGGTTPVMPAAADAVPAGGWVDCTVTSTDPVGPVTCALTVLVVVPPLLALLPPIIDGSTTTATTRTSATRTPSCTLGLLLMAFLIRPP